MRLWNIYSYFHQCKNYKNRPRIARVMSKIKRFLFMEHRVYIYICHSRRHDICLWHNRVCCVLRWTKRNAEQNVKKARRPDQQIFCAQKSVRMFVLIIISIPNIETWVAKCSYLCYVTRLSVNPRLHTVADVNLTRTQNFEIRISVEQTSVHCL